jgi:hypothetical protein
MKFCNTVLGFPGLLVLAAGLLLPSHHLGAVTIGQSTEQVKDELGKPQGIIQNGAQTVFYFKEGEVVFNNGRVVRFDIHAPKQAVKPRKPAQEESPEDKLFREAGEHERDAMLKSPKYSELSLDDKSKYWADFAKRYPSVDLTSVNTALKKEADSAKEKEDREARWKLLNSQIRELDKEITALDEKIHITKTKSGRRKLRQQKEELLAKKKAYLQEIADRIDNL